MVGEVAEAIVRYLTRVRPRCASRAVFVTLRRPYRPLSGGGLSTQVRAAQRRLGQTLQRYGPHGLRHANSTYLLGEGCTLKEIGDHLGHTMVRATEIYAKAGRIRRRQVRGAEPAGRPYVLRGTTRAAVNNAFIHRIWSGEYLTGAAITIYNLRNLCGE